MCVSVTWAVHVQVFGKIIACMDTIANIICLSACICDMGIACAGVWQDHGVQGCGCGQQGGTPGQPGWGDHGGDPGQQEGGLQRRLPRPQQVCDVQGILL